MTFMVSSSVDNSTQDTNNTVATKLRDYTNASSSSTTSSSVPTQENHQKAQLFDSQDPLNSYRHQFHIPSGIYLCGNSLGLQPKRTAKAIEYHLQKWAQLGVQGHFSPNQPWADIERQAAKLCMPIVGAAFEHELAIANSLTVNLHLMLTAFYRPTLTRFKILTEAHSFPSDRYALHSHIASRGINADEALIELAPRSNEYTLREQDILEKINQLAKKDELALILLPGVQYYTAQVLPMESISRAARKVNVPVGFDLAHAVGNVPLRLHDWGTDFAVWCHYKYLNSGPGAIAGHFVHDRHADSNLPRHAGWWGHDRSTRFEMPDEFIPQKGAHGFQLSNPSVFSILPVIESLLLFQEAGGVSVLREKSLKLTGFLYDLVTKHLGSEFEIITPQEPESRGNQLSVRLRNVDAIFNIREVEKRLNDVGVICDIREPDVLRIAPTALYNSFQDVYYFCCNLESVVKEVESNRK